MLSITNLGDISNRVPHSPDAKLWELTEITFYHEKTVNRRIGLRFPNDKLFVLYYEPPTKEKTRNLPYFSSVPLTQYYQPMWIQSTQNPIDFVNSERAVFRKLNAFLSYSFTHNAHTDSSPSFVEAGQIWMIEGQVYMTLTNDSKDGVLKIDFDTGNSSVKCCSDFTVRQIKETQDKELVGDRVKVQISFPPQTSCIL